MQPSGSAGVHTLFPARKVVVGIGSALIERGLIGQKTLHLFHRRHAPTVDIFHADRDPIQVLHDIERADLAVFVDVAEMRRAPGAVFVLHAGNMAVDADSNLLRPNDSNLRHAMRMAHWLGLTDRLRFVGVQPFPPPLAACPLAGAAVVQCLDQIILGGCVACHHRSRRKLV